MKPLSMLALARTLLLAAILFSASTHAGLPPVNRTIDDTYGDSATGKLPSYTGPWNVGQDCSGCGAQPSAVVVGAFRSSWHDATTGVNPNDGAPRAVTLSFQGVHSQRRAV